MRIPVVGCRTDRRGTYRADGLSECIYLFASVASVKSLCLELLGSIAKYLLRAV